MFPRSSSIRSTCASGLMPLVTCWQAFAQVTTPAPGTTLWATDALTKVLRSAKPAGSEADALTLSGARREIVSGQAVFRSSKAVAAADLPSRHGRWF